MEELFNKENNTEGEVTEKGNGKLERATHLKFLESLDRVNLAMRGTNDLEEMVNSVLEVTLSIFGSDRAWLVYPCDPEAGSWKAAILRTVPEYAIPEGVGLPMDAESIRIIRAVLASEKPVAFIPGTENEPPNWSGEQFNIQSQLAMAVYPKVDKPYMFGLHQCSHPRIWTDEEKELLQEIGRRLADSLTSLLVYRDLRKSEEKYRRIIQTTNEGVWVIDRNRVTTFVNPKMLALLGRREEDVVGKKVDEFIIPEEVSDHELKMEERSAGKSGFYERRILRKDGEIIWTSVSAAPLLDENGVFDGSLGMITDISEKKKIEQRMEELSEMRAKFLTIISHQLRTPLTVVNWNLEMIIGGDFGKLDDIQKNFLQGTYSASMKITNRIDDLISAMDIEEGRINFIKEEVFLDSLCSAIMNETVKKCELKEISCTYKAPEKELPIIEGDSGKIRMALTRLLENAVEYTKNGGKISAELMIKDGAARFEVEDNGIGIPEEEQHRVFTRFFRASNAFTMQPDAFGLGLYVAKSFIEQHGGRMGFESKEGKGSKFWIDLPLKSTMS